jgi:hypothetical protein
MTGGQILLEGTVRELVPALAVRAEQPGTVAQVLLEAHEPGIRPVARGGTQRRRQRVGVNVGRAGQRGLRQVHLVGQPVDFAPYALAAGAQPLAEAGFVHALAAAVGARLVTFPLVEQHVDRLGVELLAAFRQRAAAACLQPRHQRQQQRARGEFAQFAALAGTLERRRAVRRLRRAQACQVVRHVRVPRVDEALDLAAREGQQFAFREAGELPVLALVGVGTTGDQEAALAVHPGEGLHGLLDLGLRRLRASGTSSSPSSRISPPRPSSSRCRWSA